MRIIENISDSYAATFESISPELIRDPLLISERQPTTFFREHDFFSEAFFAVTRVVEAKSRNWFDIAREFTYRTDAWGSSFAHGNHHP